MSLKNENMIKLAVMFVAALSLSACGSLPVTSDGSMVTRRGPVDKFPIQVADEKEEITLVIAPHVFALSQADKNRVAMLAESYKHVGHGDIWVVAPTGSANSASSIGAAAEIAKVMVDQGIRPTSIKMNSYLAAETDESAPVTVLFRRYHAFTSDCGLWNRNIAFTPTNQSSPNLGCTTQSNLAALVEDPRDLIEPTRMDPADPARRATVFENYRAGAVTTSERSDQESGVVTDIGSE